MNLFFFSKDGFRTLLDAVSDFKSSLDSYSLCSAQQSKDPLPSTKEILDQLMGQCERAINILVSHIALLWTLINTEYRLKRVQNYKIAAETNALLKILQRLNQRLAELAFSYKRSECDKTLVLTELANLLDEYHENFTLKVYVFVESI